MSALDTTGASELTEILLRLDELEAGQPDMVARIRPALHRLVVAPRFSGAVKTLLVQALLLLDDPRIADGSSGAPLLLKIRKLVESAAASHAANPGPGLTPAFGQMALQFSPDALLSPDTDRVVVEEFVIESREQLAIAEAALLALDVDPDDVEALDTLFRALHTIKGTSAFLGIEHATELAHLAEALLVPVRTGAAACTGELSNLVFRSIDMLDAMLVAIESAVDGETALLPDGFRPLLALLRAGPCESGTSTAGRRVSGSVRRIRPFDTSVRVRTEDLDRLGEVVRELILTHAMVSRDASLRAAGNHELARKIAHAERLAYELEDVSVELRTVSFAATLQKLARVARDAAYQSGKTIDLATEGEGLLVERVMADAMADPLMHMVRNAIDHGIETADQRARAGKREAGQVRIAAQRVGTQLVIEVSDDGAGMSCDTLRRAAVDRGLLAPDARPSDEELYSLIFHPGFSTAAVVTDLSGRGVGMDVVRTNVEAVGGTIAIASRRGQGTTFTIRLPFRSQPAKAAQSNWVEAQRTIGLIA